MQVRRLFWPSAAIAEAMAATMAKMGFETASVDAVSFIVLSPDAVGYLDSTQAPATMAELFELPEGRTLAEQLGGPKRIPFAVVPPEAAPDIGSLDDPGIPSEGPRHVELPTTMHIHVFDLAEGAKSFLYDLFGKFVEAENGRSMTWASMENDYHQAIATRVDKGLSALIEALPREDAASDEQILGYISSLRSHVNEGLASVNARLDDLLARHEPIDPAGV